VLSGSALHSLGERPRVGRNPYTFFYEKSQGPHTVLFRGKSAVDAAMQRQVANALEQAQYQTNFYQIGPEVLRLAITGSQIQTNTADNTASSLEAIQTTIRESNAGIVIEYQKRVRVS
jgi:hypothetical protein